MARALFADTAYYVALVNPYDSLHAAASAIHIGEPSQQIVTTDAVLVELLAYFAKRGSYFRSLAVKSVDETLGDSRTTIIHQDAALFFAGLDLYRARLDKGYSLTDCMSMLVCKQQQIEDVLTHDRHFD